MEEFFPEWRYRTSPPKACIPEVAFFPLKYAGSRKRDEKVLVVDDSGVMRKNYSPEGSTVCGSMSASKPLTAWRHSRNLASGEGFDLDRHDWNMPNIERARTDPSRSRADTKPRFIDDHNRIENPSLVAIRGGVNGYLVKRSTRKTLQIKLERVLP